MSSTDKQERRKSDAKKALLLIGAIIAGVIVEIFAGQTLAYERLAGLIIFGVIIGTMVTVGFSKIVNG
jgi:uncharacterized membrane protein (DUF441 family)